MQAACGIQKELRFQGGVDAQVKGLLNDHLGVLIQAGKVQFVLQPDPNNIAIIPRLVHLQGHRVVQAGRAHQLAVAPLVRSALRVTGGQPAARGDQSQQS